MIERNENIYLEYDGAEQCVDKSVISRKRKWARIACKLLSFGLEDFTGVFVDATKGGLIRIIEKLQIKKSFVTGTFSVEKCEGPYDCLWSKECKFVRIKSKFFSNHSKKKRKRNLYKNVKKEPIVKDATKLNKQHQNKAKVSEKIGSEENDKHLHNELEEYDNDEQDDEFEIVDENKLSHKKMKSVPKSFSYLYSDRYIESRKSKRRSFNIKQMKEDFCLKVHRKYKKYNIPNFNEEIDNFTILEPRASLSDFFQLDYATKLEFTDSEREPEIFADGTDDVLININLTKAEPINTSLSNVSEINHIEPKEQTELIYAEAPDIATRSTSQLESDQEFDNLNENRQNRPTDELQTIFLSRSATRPDNLEHDFKSNYKEAQCKPRRFIINISHLAYQHFVLNAIKPLHILPQLDLSLYLIFSFIREVKNDIDEYRVEINTTLPLQNPENIISPSVSTESQSVYEIMQRTITALNSFNLNLIPKKKRANLKDDATHKASHSFNLLASACKWNIQIMDYPHSIEWMEDINTELRLPFMSDSKELFPKQPSLSKLERGHDSVKLGPQKPSFCGLCLKDFGVEHKNSFPLALCFCSHWFCEMCWKASVHIHKDSINNFHNFYCLEKGCSSKMDVITMLSLLPIQSVRNFEVRKWKTAIESNPKVKQCPNQSCNKIIFTKDLHQVNYAHEAINVICLCMYQKCFSCLSSPHWPISCAVAEIYNRRMSLLNHNTNGRMLDENELPDVVLRGKCCPKCGLAIKVNFQSNGLKNCSCGCIICWGCGKEVDQLQMDQHLSCIQQFQGEDVKLKERLNCHDKYQYPVKNGDATRWYKVALINRRFQHPQVVSILHKMAGQIAEVISQVSQRGKNVGNVKQASVGWKKSFAKVSAAKFKTLRGSQVMTNNNTLDLVENKDADRNRTKMRADDDNNNNNYGDQSIDCRTLSSCSVSSLSSTGSYLLVREISTDSFIMSRFNSKSITHCDPLIMKAMLNVVDTKLELHHIIEHVAILLEYSHTLQQPGKIIRCLERAEDLCTYLDLLLQPTHVEGSSRIIPSFLRLRMQCANLLSALCTTLKENFDCTNTKI